jgi:hypothetical protein
LEPEEEMNHRNTQAQRRKREKERTGRMRVPIFAAFPASS